MTRDSPDGIGIFATLRHRGPDPDGIGIFDIEAVAGRGYLGVDRGAELRRRIARHRGLIDGRADIVEQVIDSVEPAETEPGP